MYEDLNKTNYNLIFKAIIPIGILLFFILLSELKTEGDFGGLFGGFRTFFFFLVGIGIFLFTFFKNTYRIKKEQNVKESKIILILLVIATIISISSFFFPYDFFDRDPEFVASDIIGNELKLYNGDFVLKTREIEWTTIRRGKYKVDSDTIKLDIDKERYLSKRAMKYFIQGEYLIPIYKDKIEKDSIGFLKIIKDLKNIRD